MTLNNVTWEIVLVALVIVSTVFHELGHGFVALRLGDPTAKMMGRLTLNPLRHLDPFGSVVLPLLMALAGGPVFAFAKPVPYNPNNLRNPRRDEVLVALAGPACNLLQALIGAGAFRLAVSQGVTTLTQTGYVGLSLLASYVYVNLVLMFFNLIPLPPLDGSKVISPLLKGEARRTYYEIQRYSMPIMLAIFYLCPMVLGFNPISAYCSVTAGGLYTLLLGA